MCTFLYVFLDKCTRLFHAAKSLDQAILVCKELGDLREVAALADRACNMYQTHGSADAGASSLDKAAKLLEQQNPEQALHLYQRAAEVALVDTIKHTLLITVFMYGYS